MWQCGIPQKCISAAQLSNTGDEGTGVWLHVITSRWIDRLTLKERLHIQHALRPSRKGEISLHNKREWYKSVILSYRINERESWYGLVLLFNSLYKVLFWFKWLENISLQTI